jgi:hypothetical protein
VTGSCGRAGRLDACLSGGFTGQIERTAVTSSHDQHLIPGGQPPGFRVPALRQIATEG